MADWGFWASLAFNYSSNEKAEIKESQLREESWGCHLLFILSTSPDGRDKNHMSARAQGEARQLPTLTRPEPEPEPVSPRLPVLYSLVCCPCCHFYQIRRLHESCCLFNSSVGPWTRPTGENKYNRTTFRTKSLLSFLENITFMSFDIFLRLKKRDKKLNIYF